MGIASSIEQGQRVIGTEGAGLHQPDIQFSLQWGLEAPRVGHDVSLAHFVVMPRAHLTE